MTPEWKSANKECPGCTGPSPIHQHPGELWWWYDETWGEECGPFETREEAEKSLQEYIAYYL